MGASYAGSEWQMDFGESNTPPSLELCDLHWLWQYFRPHHWCYLQGLAVGLQGDSRKCCELLQLLIHIIKGTFGAAVFQSFFLPVAQEPRALFASSCQGCALQQAFFHAIVQCLETVKEGTGQNATKL